MVGIFKKNFLVFASTDTAHKAKQTNLDGSSALKYCTKDLALQNPEKITATRNRHYMSTLYNGWAFMIQWKEDYLSNTWVTILI